jgi:hypothetical protein
VRAEVLVQALPHMQRYDEQVVVIKYGGHAMGDRAAAEDFAEDIVLLEHRASSPSWSMAAAADRPDAGQARIKSEFRGGPSVTDAATVEVVEMVLAGSINKQIVGWIGAEGRQGRGPCAARTATWWWPGKVPARPSIGFPHPKAWWITAFVGEPGAREPRGLDRCSRRS